MDEQRLIDLEVRIAFQDDLIQSLNAEVFQATQKIERMEVELRQLREALEVLQVALGPDVRQEAPPPHW
jgi:SlyX protein